MYIFFRRRLIRAARLFFSRAVAAAPIETIDYGKYEESRFEGGCESISFIRVINFLRLWADGPEEA